MSHVLGPPPPTSSPTSCQMSCQVSCRVSHSRLRGCKVCPKNLKWPLLGNVEKLVLGGSGIRRGDYGPKNLFFEKIIYHVKIFGLYPNLCFNKAAADDSDSQTPKAVRLSFFGSAALPGSGCNIRFRPLFVFLPLLETL